LVTVLSTESCGQCFATYRALDSKGIEYKVRNMSEDPEAMSLAKELGYLRAPVVIAGEDHWSGFRPDLIQNLS